MSQITTNNYSDAALDSSSTASQTTTIIKGKMMNDTTTTANTTISTEDLDMNKTTEVTHSEVQDLIIDEVIKTTPIIVANSTTTGEQSTQVTVVPNRVTTSTTPWIRMMQTVPTASEIQERKEARRVDLIAENYGTGCKYNVNDVEKSVSILIDEGKLLSQCLNITLESGEKLEVEDLILKGNHHRVKDLIEPEFGTGRLMHKYYFDAEYATTLREGETFKVVYTLDSIKKIIKKLFGKTIAKQNFLSALIKVLTVTKVSSSDIYSVEKRLEESFIIDKGNTFVADALKAIREAKKVVPVVQETDYEQRAFGIMKDYAVLNNQGKPQIINTTKLGLVASSESGLKALFKNQLINGENPVDIWMHSKNRPIFTDTKFDPSCSTDDDKYNLFKGFKHKAISIVDISFFKNFVKEVICSGDDKMYNIVWSFLAQMLQDPSRKMGTALVLLSSKGTGKSTFVKVIGELLKGYFYQSADNKRLLGEFNTHLETTLLFYANELTFTDNKRVISKLKNVITEKNFTYEIKGGATYSADNLIRVIIDSNDDIAVVQTADERRFIYPLISERMIENTEYFNELHALFETKGFYESLMYDLMHYDYQPWEHYLKTPPKNEVTEEQVMESFIPIESWWLNCLETGVIPYVSYEVVYDGRLHIANEALYQSFAKHTRANGGRVKVDSIAFAKAMKKHILKDIDLDIKSKILVDKVRKNSRVYETRDKSMMHYANIKKLNNLDYDGTPWEVCIS
ncbi:hypothetical protein GJV85_03475 [Sulfurimonas aquatica]|uniref:NrS-1 polymerase-like helicase domain-containing protein n=1 Tax=Sulfurimonas aquatica TaxID=2672570 RepID=A0A975GC36_9BACT|nr:primase-helicase family protein [Sulfurimonas aquatica]QSZ41210.1 hypothetical protein GJV85_03475 [Sulfurimonas aquatica]